MAGSNGFFEANSPFGNLTNWEPQSGGNATVTEQRASALGRDGDEIRGKGYDKREAVTGNYVSTATSGNLALPDVGGLHNNYLLESLQVSYSNTGFPTMTASGHKHLDGNADANTRVYKPSVVLPATDLGAPLIIKDTENNTVFSLTEAAAFSVRSLQYQLQINHVDELKANGTHLAGDNYDGVETLTIEFSGSGTKGTDFTVDETNWHLDSNGKNESNTGMTTQSITLTRHIPHYVAPANSGT